MAVKKLVHGVGTNDADYKVKLKLDSYNPLQNKVVWRCPYYERWLVMLNRCYSIKFQERQPTYKGCTVCEEWLTFSTFRKWMVDQNWKGLGGEDPLHLDKDLLKAGNKVYCPEYCTFIHRKINQFIVSRSFGKKGYLIGCSFNKAAGKYHAYINNTMTDGYNREYLGSFDTEQDAHFAWKFRKNEIASHLANSKYVTDVRVKQALLVRYENYTVLEDHLR